MLFDLHCYYVYARCGQWQQMWELLDRVIHVARAIGTAKAAAVRALALAWKSYSCLRPLQDGHDMSATIRESLSEMLLVYDQTLLSSVISAEVRMALGFYIASSTMWHGFSSTLTTYVWQTCCASHWKFQHRQGMGFQTKCNRAPSGDGSASHPTELDTLHPV